MCKVCILHPIGHAGARNRPARCSPTAPAAATADAPLVGQRLAGRMAQRKAKGEVNEIINALEHLSAQNGSRPDVVQVGTRLAAQKEAGSPAPTCADVWCEHCVLARLSPPPPSSQNKRDCFQKLIRYMTQGIDMSAAFVPATKCVALSKHDLPLKKMLYLYLRTAAKQNAAVALLVVQVRQGSRAALGQPGSRLCMHCRPTLPLTALHCPCRRC